MEGIPHPFENFIATILICEYWRDLILQYGFIFRLKLFPKS